MSYLLRKREGCPSCTSHLPCEVSRTLRAPLGGGIFISMCAIRFQVPAGVLLLISALGMHLACTLGPALPPSLTAHGESPTALGGSSRCGIREENHTFMSFKFKSQ